MQLFGLVSESYDGQIGGLCSYTCLAALRLNGHCRTSLLLTVSALDDWPDTQRLQPQFDSRAKEKPR